MAEEELILPARYSRNPDGTLRVEEPEPVDEFPIRDDITVLPADDPKKLRLGWVIHEEVGVVIINDYAITNITMEPPEVEDIVEEIIPIPEIIDLDMSHLFDDLDNRFNLMDI